MLKEKTRTEKNKIEVQPFPGVELEAPKVPEIQVDAALKVLEDGLALISDPERWCADELRTGETAPYSYCSLGAAHKVSRLRGKIDEIYQIDELARVKRWGNKRTIKGSRKRAVCTALMYLQDVVWDRTKTHDSISGFNDSQEHEDVVAIWKEAAQRRRNDLKTGKA